MKRIIALVLCLVLTLSMIGCGDKKHNVIIDSQHTSECEVNTSYLSGEEVSIKLPTITEHYYRLFANGNEILMDMEQSDMIFTYFVFTMPDEDVEVVIEDHWVSIPYSPESTEE